MAQRWGKYFSTKSLKYIFCLSLFDLFLSCAMVMDTQSETEVCHIHENAPPAVSAVVFSIPAHSTICQPTRPMRLPLTPIHPLCMRQLICKSKSTVMQNTATLSINTVVLSCIQMYICKLSSSRFAYIELSSVEEVERTIKEKQGLEIEGRTVILERADNFGQKKTKPEAAPEEEYNHNESEIIGT